MMGTGETPSFFSWRAWHIKWRGVPRPRPRPRPPAVVPPLSLEYNTTYHSRDSLHHPMKVVFSAVAISVATGVIVPCVAGSSGRHDVSWWHAMDGIPILMERRPGRKMSVENHSSVVHSKGVGDWSGEAVATHGRLLAFGDYVDTTFSCPATVTCPVVCVASVEYCPEDAICPGTHPDNEGDPDHEYEVGCRACIMNDSSSVLLYHSPPI
jgi:hypothetical protein